MDTQRRLAWSRHPQGVLIVAALATMELLILAVTRHLSWLGYTKELPSWAQVIQHDLLQLCDSTLEAEAFDDVYVRPRVGLHKICAIPSFCASRGRGDLRLRSGRRPAAERAVAARRPAAQEGDRAWTSTRRSLTDGHPARYARFAVVLPVFGALLREQ